MLLQSVIFALLATGAFARTTPTTQNTLQEEARSQETPSSFLGDLRYVYKVYQECSSKDLAPCLKLKLIAAMDRAARNFPQLSLIEGVTFVQDPQSPAINEVQTEAEIEDTLPRTLNEKENALNNLIVDKIGRFFESHTLQVFPFIFNY